MPSLVRVCVFTAALLAAAVADAGQAHAELTEADKVGQRAFIACLDENGNNEDDCFDILDRYAWYPRDASVCESVAARLKISLAAWDDAGGQPKPEPFSDAMKSHSRDLFFNERCARRGLPHNIEAARDPDTPGLRSEYNACLAETGASIGSCNEQLGEHRYYPTNDGDCAFNLSTITRDIGAGWHSLWSTLFDNERCRRLGLTFALPIPLKPVVGPMQDDIAGIRDFSACLDKNGNDEASCIETLGRHAWYPSSDETCKSVATRVDRILSVDGDPVSRDMFQNERCARLGKPHSSLALPDEKTIDPDQPSTDCWKKKTLKGGKQRCYEIHGYHEWSPVGAVGACEFIASVPVKYPNSKQKEWWRHWFKNERCRRMGRSYYESAAGVAHEAAVEIVQ